MWIKKTVVRSGGVPITYLQLVKTVYENGHSRQIVVANLGREEHIDLNKAKQMARLITDKPNVFLPDELLEPLSMRKYGEPLLLDKMFDATGLRRSFEHLADAKGFPRGSVDTAFGVLAYYSFSTNKMDIRCFFQKYYVSHIDHIDNSMLLDAFQLLHNTVHVHPGLAQKYHSLAQRNQVRLVYLFSVPIDPVLSQDSISISVTTNSLGIPLHYRYGFDIAERLHLPGDEDTIYVTDLPDEKLLAPFPERAYHFIYHIGRKQLTAYLSQNEYADLLSQEEIAIHGDILYQEMDLRGYRFFVIRPFMENLSKGTSLPRDIYVTDLDWDTRTILQTLKWSDSIESSFYNICLPQNAHFLLKHFSKSELVDILVNIGFLSFFLEHMLNQKLSVLGITASDAYAICRSMLVFPLHYQNRRQYLYNLSTPEQSQILNLLDFDESLQ